jgi:hypothetical protein
VKSIKHGMYVGRHIISDDPLLCADRICEHCGQDHDFRPEFGKIKTSINIICEHIDQEQKARVIPVKDELVIYKNG